MTVFLAGFLVFLGSSTALALGLRRARAAEPKCESCAARAACAADDREQRKEPR